MMVTIPFDMTPAATGILAADTGDLIQLIVIAVIMIGSAVASVLSKKKQDQQQEQQSQEGQAPPAPPQRRWPPVGGTTGTTVPPPARPRPPGPGFPPPQTARSAPTPPMAKPVPRNEPSDLTRQRGDSMDAEMRRRDERMVEAQTHEDVARTQAAAAERIRRAAEKAERAAQRARQAAAPTESEFETTARTVVDTVQAAQPRELPDRLKALMAQPNWRTAVIMAEILSPPVGLRDPNSQSATTPPGSRPL